MVTIRNRRKISLATPKKQGVISRSSSWLGRWTLNYGRDLRQGLVMFPRAAYSSVVRQYQDFQMLSKAQKRVTDWVLFFFFMLFILAMVFWFIIATKFSEAWFVGPIPVFVLGYFYFFRKRRKRVYELFESWFMTPEEEDEAALITVQTLREVALFRIKDVEKRLNDFRKMEKDDQKRLAPEMVVQCMEVFGAEYASLLKKRLDEAAQSFEEETESDN